MTKHEIIVVGMSGDVLPSKNIGEYIERCSTIVATASVIEQIKKIYENDSNLKRWVLITPVARCLDIISAAISSHSVLVLTSGDPLFYGFGQTLIKRFSTNPIVFLPALSSLQLCFAKFGIPWSDAAFVSLHGRSFNNLDSVLHEDKIFILTDKANSPRKIAQHLLDILPKSEQQIYKMHVGVKLGTNEEETYTGSLQEISNNVYGQPNCVILQRTEKKPKLAASFGLLETEIRHSRGLITKNEVRAAVLHALRLPSTGIFWDIGAGSGSVSIEAALLNPGLSVFAVERKQQEVDNIEHNRAHFKCWNISVCHGSAPEALQTLPAPDCIFVGGSGGSLGEIIKYVSDTNLLVKRIVLTGVIKDTIDSAPRLLYQSGYALDVSVVSTSRYTFPETETVQFNPIHIIRALRKHE